MVAQTMVAISCGKSGALHMEGKPAASLCMSAGSIGQLKTTLLQTCEAKQIDIGKPNTKGR